MAMRMKDIAHTFFRKRLRILFIFSLSLLLLPFQTISSHAASPPTAPQYVEAMADVNQVAITWDPPGNNGGESNLNYTARIWNLPPPTNTAAFASCSTTQLGCIISGLISGTVYYVDVIASNSAGAGAPSASKSISPGSTGKPPSNVSATSDAKGLITIQWTPLTSAGTGVFAWYTAEVFTGTDIGVGSYSGYCTSGAITDSSCFIGGLKLGATYYAQVRTYTSLGSGFPSFPRIKIIAGTPAAPSASPTPTQTAPTNSTSPQATNSPSQSSSSKSTPIATSKATSSSPAQSVKVVALSKALRVSWSPPKYTGGLKILGYRVEAFGGGTDALMHQCRTSAKVLTCTFKNLGSMQVYNLAVFVVFAGAESPSSKIFRVVTKS